MSEAQVAPGKSNVYARIHAVMRAVGYVQKNAATGSSRDSPKGVARDEVVAEVRAHLLAAGVIAYTTQLEGRYVETSAKSSSGTQLMIYVGRYRTTFQSIHEGDSPSYFHVEHEAQGNDYGDKAPGKAATYAEKLNLVKGLMLETGIADESRNPGEGDQPEDKPAAPQGKPAIKQPKEKGEAAAAAPAAADDGPASKGLISMLKAEAEAKGLTATVEKKLKKAGHSWDAMPKSVAVKARAQVEAAESALTKEPGSDG